ncbi:MAG: hypothetical protein VX949_04705 [Planctomycetota bacterium]|nr:hypothetical protein [Planctomycetota bacterium]
MVVEELWGMHTHPVLHRKAIGWSSQRRHGRKIRQIDFLLVVSGTGSARDATPRILIFG